MLKNKAPRIEKPGEIKLVGKRVEMSTVANKTGELWKSFMPRRGEINNIAGAELYSVEVYDSPDFIKNFDSHKVFEKWAAVSVSSFDSIPPEMETLVIPEGLYAVFIYVGRASEALESYQYIFNSWLPDSGYTLDGRPHFALMGDKYKNNDPSSEEELWIPVKEK